MTGLFGRNSHTITTAYLRKKALHQTRFFVGNNCFHSQQAAFAQDPRGATSRSSDQRATAQGQTQPSENPVTDIISGLIRPSVGTRHQREHGFLGRSIASIEEQPQNANRSNPKGYNTSTIANGLFGSNQGSIQRPFVRPPPPLRLNPYVGREIEVVQQKGVPVSRALRQMELLCALNKIRSDHHRLKFHERAGLARKRLRRERWRRTFKDGFRDTVKQIHEMRKRGW